MADVAVLLRCSKAHVCKAIQGRVRGVTRLPALSMGRRKLIRRQTLEEWLVKNDPTGVGGTMDTSHKGTPVSA